MPAAVARRLPQQCAHLHRLAVLISPASQGVRLLLDGREFVVQLRHQRWISIAVACLAVVADQLHVVPHELEIKTGFEGRAAQGRAGGHLGLSHGTAHYMPALTCPERSQAPRWSQQSPPAKGKPSVQHGDRFVLGHDAMHATNSAGCAAVGRWRAPAGYLAGAMKCATAKEAARRSSPRKGAIPAAFKSDGPRVTCSEPTPHHVELVSQRRPQRRGAARLDQPPVKQVKV